MLYEFQCRYEHPTRSNFAFNLGKDIQDHFEQ